MCRCVEVHQAGKDKREMGGLEQCEWGQPSNASVCDSGAGVVGVSVRRLGSAAPGAGFQEDAAAAELARAVGRVARGRRQPGAEAARGQRQLPQGGAAVPAQVVLLQVRSGAVREWYVCVL